MFFFNDTATTEIYTLSLHDALPIYEHDAPGRAGPLAHQDQPGDRDAHSVAHLTKVGAAGDALAIEFIANEREDRKSTRLNSSHANISYAVFCLIKKTNNVPSSSSSL